MASRPSDALKPGPDDSGDRVRARLSYHNPGGTPVLRVGLEPGLLVRGAAVPGAVDVSWEGTADRPEWVARVEPPLTETGRQAVACHMRVAGSGHSKAVAA